MPKYRISKYDPKNRDSTGHYLRKEWTSCFDIGKIFDGKLFKKEEYLRTEKLYIEVVLEILKNKNSQFLITRDVEHNFTVEKVAYNLSSVGLTLSEQEKTVLKTLQPSQKITRSQLPVFLALILRECFGCGLTVPDVLDVEFGYDYYIYATVESIAEETIEKFAQEGIFIENLT